MPDTHEEADYLAAEEAELRAFEEAHLVLADAPPLSEDILSLDDTLLED